MTPQKIYLKVDSDKRAYIRYPDGTYGGSVNGVIDTTWSGNAGAIRLIVPKYTDPVADRLKNIQLSTNPAGTSGDYVGKVRYRGVGKFYTIGCPKITDVIADKAWFVNMSGSSVASATLPKVESIFAANCTQLTTITAPFWNAANFPNCALTAKAIGDLLLAAIENNPAAQYLNCLGGTNASDTAIDDYLVTQGADLATVLSALPSLSASFNT